MADLCTNRPEGIKFVSNISRPLPSQCFFDSILSPMPAWVLMMALLLLPLFFPAYDDSDNGEEEEEGAAARRRARPGSRRRWVRRGARAAHWALAGGAVVVQVVEVARLAAAGLGVGLLPFAAAGAALAGTGAGHRVLALRRGAATAAAAAFWAASAGVAAAKAAALGRFLGPPEEGGESPLERPGSAYPLPDQLADAAALAAACAVLAVLEPLLYLCVLPRARGAAHIELSGK